MPGKQLQWRDSSSSIWIINNREPNKGTGASWLPLACILWPNVQITVLNHSTRCHLLLRPLPLTRQWGFSFSSLLSRLQQRQQQHQTWPLRCDQAEPSSLPLISWRAASAAGCPRFTMCTPPTLHSPLPVKILHLHCGSPVTPAGWEVVA